MVGRGDARQSLSVGGVLVTGAAGFLGSHLIERLLADGRAVVGVDGFTDSYDPAVKRENLARVADHPRFHLLELDLSRDDLTALPHADWVFHLAAQAGVRGSWGASFARYESHNVLATQRLLERFRARPPQRFVYASSSSVYGDAERHPTREEDPPQPFSPYGVTKLAAEQLALVYHRNFGVPCVVLRPFTLYGPRQRPDMGFHRFFEALLDDRPIAVHGDGSQRRDFTYVADCVEAFLAAAERGLPGRVYNVGGGVPTELSRAIRLAAHAADRTPRLEYGERAAGDVAHTSADTTRARSELGWEPKVFLEEGLARQLAWHQERRVAHGRSQ